jgi:hypothetical protein
VRQAVIENPVINSAFAEPGKHYKFDDDGITDEIVASRRPSAYVIPVAQPKKKGKQLERRRRRLAQARLPGRHAHDAPLARVLAAAKPRPPPLLLPDRGRRDGDLPH